MAWFQIMTWKKPGMLRAVPSMLRAVPDDALVDDAVTAAGLRTWKKHSREEDRAKGATSYIKIKD